MKVDENKRAWDGKYHWKDGGEEWSAPWGGVSMQWFGAILPRIRAHVPAPCILEIACGYGRFTQYLKDLCERLVAVDLSGQCIEACRKRFEHCSNVECHVTDGRSLGMVADRSVDFVFSYDSLVHADEGVMASYVRELARILTDEGAAFIHHSNLAEYEPLYARIWKVPKLPGLLACLGLPEKTLHWRDKTVDAGKVARMAEENGLTAVSQEIVPWHTRRLLIDCFTILVRKGSRRDAPPRVVRNRRFEAETRALRGLSALYPET
ncbi:MAG: class I SAM-dependent methyltransferase [Kiritimatiellae bacterium]|nr:class I SAM-dependent methyltransferase [Kiritimatiellia bacterium]